MAERRMFTKKITESDAFLDMPLSAQALYFHINMAADDEGFVNNPKKIQRMIGACEDDLKLLILKNFLITYDTGVIVIKHWKMHNYIQKDRFHPTVYQEERQTLRVKENGAYTLNVNKMDTDCIQDASTLDTEVRLGKDSIGKVNKEKDKPKGLSKKKTPEDRSIIPPTVEMVREYCNERKNDIDPENFVDFYTSKGWKIGKDKMKDWQATVRTWEKNRKKETKKNDDLEGWLND